MSHGADTGLRLPGAVMGTQNKGRRLLRNPSLVLARTFLGKANFARRSVALGRLMYRALQMCAINALRTGFCLGQRVQKICDLVDEPSGSRGIMDGRDCVPYSDYRCVHARLWSDLGSQVNERTLVSEGSRSAHQRTGVVGGVESHEELRQVPQEQFNSFIILTSTKYNKNKKI